MEYFIGVDGGATKTLAVVGDLNGRILGSGLSGPSNYHVFGMAMAMDSVQKAIARAVEAAGLTSGGTPVMSILGISGADFPDDFKRLTEGCSAFLGGLPFRVVNDCWVALRGGTRRGWGVVAVNGTGGNYAGCNAEGEQIILRGMVEYECGNRGGAGDIVREALHRTFRADEGAGPETALQTRIPAAVGVESMQEIADAFYAGNIHPAMGMPIVPVVFALANEGDRVSQQILIDLGDAMGQAAGGIARRLGIGGAPFDVVLAGSVWGAESPLLRDQFTTALHRLAPKAVPVLPEFEPAVGAYLMALDESGVPVTDETYAQLTQTVDKLAQY
ncbi:MAG: BadF/BadG/BcrA/BcrD ATPase family protein [Mycobacterium leprae]